MSDHFDAVVIGGGCLGSACAVAIQRRLRAMGRTKARVCVIEKHVVASGLSARHSGIVRAANADPVAAELAKKSIRMWHALEDFWGVPTTYDAAGALWIATDRGDGDNPKWRKLSVEMASAGIDFRKVSQSEAREVCPPIVGLYDHEVYYFEPGAIQLDPSVVRSTLYEALQHNKVVTFEQTTVTGFERDDLGNFTSVITDRGHLSCDYVVNAAGPWSPSIFGGVGLSIPVSIEPVNVANWITSQRDIAAGMPIIADYVNLAYFRIWRDGEIHMHQPRRRSSRDTARAFSENPLSITGADFVTDPANQTLGYSQIKFYEDVAGRRLENIDSTVYGSGYRSYFDITPDLRFILGPDHRAQNLIHCLGAGQAFKYAPVFGEVIADYITGRSDYSSLGDHFPIGRFDDEYMKGFWQQVRGVNYSLATESASL